MLKLLKKFARFFRSHQKFLLVGLVLVGFLTLSVGPVLAAAAGTTDPAATLPEDDTNLTFLGKLIVRVIGFIASLFLWVEGQIISLLIWALLFFAQYNDFITSKAVSLGWQIVRDVANMGFVLILLIIAIATILQVETYNYKKLLPKLLILAVLINFSKLICGIFIDFAQVVMLTFVYSFAGTAGSGNFISALGVDKAMNFGPTTMETEMAKAGLNFLYIVGSYVFLVILAAVFIMVLLVMLAVFVMRIVMLWLLVVLSPLAYILAAFPQGQRYAQQWWSEFSKYVIIGPVLGFFLWLSLAVALSGTAALRSQPAGSPFGTTAGATAAGTGGATPAGQSQSNLLSQITETTNFANLVIALALLIGSLIITQQIGVAGGSFAGQMASRIQQTGLGALLKPVKGLAGLAAYPIRGAGRTIGRYIQERAPALTPTFWKGFAKRGERLVEEARIEAGGRGEEFAERFFKGKEAAIPRGEIARRQVTETRISDYMKQMGGVVTKEKMVELAGRALATTGEEGEISREAFLELATRQGNLDDVIQYALTSGQINEKNYQQWGYDSWEQAQNATNDVASKIFTMHFMGLDRSKFDPEKIFEEMLRKKGLNTKIGQQVIDIGLGEDYKKLTEKEQEKLREIDVTTQEDYEKYTETYKTAETQSATNAQIAGKRDKDSLRALAAISEACRNVGHWEQAMGRADGKGNYYVMSDRQKVGEILGEFGKRPTREAISKTAPHIYRSRFYNPETGQIEVSTDPQLLSRVGKAFLGKGFTESMARDLHQAQRRISGQFVGALAEVGVGNALFDEEGKFYEGEGTVGQRAARKKISEERWFKWREHNEAISDAMLRLHFYGNALSPNAVPVEGQEWEGVAAAKKGGKPKGGGPAAPAALAPGERPEGPLPLPKEVMLKVRGNVGIKNQIDEALDISGQIAGPEGSLTPEELEKRLNDLNIDLITLISLVEQLTAAQPEAGKKFEEELQPFIDKIADYQGRVAKGESLTFEERDKLSRDIVRYLKQYKKPEELRMVDEGEPPPPRPRRR